MRVDDWEFWVIVGVVGFSWEFVVGDWSRGCWLAQSFNFSMKKFYVYYSILQ